MRRTTGLTRSSTPLHAALLALVRPTPRPCPETYAPRTAASAIRHVPHQVGAATDGDTIDLVSAAVQTAAADDTAQGADTGDRKGLRGRMLRALHGTWVTESKAGPVTHQAVRGDVTAVSGSSITVKAKDGFSLTFSVAGDTKVRARTAGKGTASTIGAVKVGSKALVVGLGATNPTARVVVFKVTT